MFIAVPNEIKENIQDVSPNNWRVQTIVVRTLTSKILIINSYLPTDTQLQDFDTSEVLTTLSAINDVINDNEFDNLMWTGDLNADFNRNTTFVKVISEYIDTKDLIKSWDKFPIDYTHSVEIDERTFTSTLDHFIWSKDLDHCIMDADVLNFAQNMSDHSPIYCQFRTKDIGTRIEVNNNITMKPSWKKASPQQKSSYMVTLQSRLDDLKITENVKT